jgi:hypothetical protein
MFKHLEEKITDNGIKLNDGIIQFGEAEMHDQKVKTLPLIPFLEFYGIKYMYCYLDIEEKSSRKRYPPYSGHKEYNTEKKKYGRDVVKMDDFEKKWIKREAQNKLFKPNQKKKVWVSPKDGIIRQEPCIAIDCFTVQQIDFDTKEEKIDPEIYGLLKKLPYTRSITKKYGRHLFFIDSTIKNDRRSFTAFLEEYAYYFNEKNEKKSGADYLSNWAVVPCDTIVYNADKLIQETISLSKYLSTPKNKKKQNIKNKKAKTEKKGYIVKDISNNLNGKLHIEDDSDDEQDEPKRIKKKEK